MCISGYYNKPISNEYYTVSRDLWDKTKHIRDTDENIEALKLVTNKFEIHYAPEIGYYAIGFFKKGTFKTKDYACINDAVKDLLTYYQLLER